ncbi:MAG: DNA/RNA nuclease SfsA [bacterium]
MKGYFIKRYKRFLVDLETNSGNQITAYCPATGRMTSCLRKRAPCEYLRVSNSDRKLDYDWWSIKMPESWVIVDTRPANHWLYWTRTAPWLPSDWSTANWKAEPELPNGGRLDFRLERSQQPDTWVEVKSVTWAENGTGYFPDAPTSRGRRHLKDMIELSRAGYRVYVTFICMRSDIEEIRPARNIDPEFAELLETARRQDVNLLGIKASVDSRSLKLNGTIPVKTGSVD